VHSGRSLGTVNLGSVERGFFTPHDEQNFAAILELVGSFLGAHDLAETELARANTDQLTGSLSRMAILEHLENEFSGEPKPSLLYLDLDGFKAINDTHGHAHGDELLRVLAQRTTAALRRVDRLGRLGGDEFLVVVSSDPTGEVARQIAARIDEVCSMPAKLQSAIVQLRVSIGVASMTPETTTSQELLNDADDAMYAAKRSPERIAVADETIRDMAATIARIDRDLDEGLQTGEITYDFQPVRDITTREIIGAEALIRWRHSRLGAIAAATLIERLERTGRTETFTEWSIRRVVADWATVRARVPGFEDKAVAINLSPRQLAWSRYVDLHFDALDEYGLKPQDVVVEVVESTEINAGDAAEQTLQRLGEADVPIALDDFGTGHNALGYFTRFPVEAIKFDRSLVGVAHESDHARTILAGLSSICHELGVISIGEGVETEVEARMCQQLGITYGQGWHFGRPGDLESFIELALGELMPTRPRSRRSRRAVG